MSQLEKLAERKESSLTDMERALLAEFMKICKKVTIADSLAREVHALLSTPLRRTQDSLQRVSTALRAYSTERDKTPWNDGAPEDFSVSCVICEWENGHTDTASMHHYTDRTSAWIPNTPRQGENESLYRGLRVTRWRWAGPAVPVPDSSVRIWRWREAPGELRFLSDHGGDEDWVCLVPKEMVDDYLPFIHSLGVCRVSNHSLTDGRKVFIGAHA